MSFEALTAAFREGLPFAGVPTLSELTESSLSESYSTVLFTRTTLRSAVAAFFCASFVIGGIFFVSLFPFPLPPPPLCLPPPRYIPRRCLAYASVRCAPSPQKYFKWTGSLSTLNLAPQLGHETMVEAAQV
jgi:hypothetical protein